MKLSISIRLAIGLFALVAAARAERWHVQYLYDEAKSDLTINDLAFPTPQRGVAVGYIDDRQRQRSRGAAVVTSDGGANWSVVPLPDTGLSVFFLNDSIGWVVTPKGIYRTEEGGRSWKKIPKSPKGTLRVFFHDSQHGYAAGLNKSVSETTDGGKSWKPLPAVTEVKSDPEYTAFTSISFAGPVGYITGFNQPPRRDDSHVPDWMEPEKAAVRKEWPSTSILIGTVNAGKTWGVTSSSLFGHISRVRMSPDGRGLGLIEFRYNAVFPSEVIAINLKTGHSESVYADKKRAVTDVALVRSGPAYLAASEVTGRLRAPIPSALHILKSDDMKLWKEMEVDYRANARKSVLAAVDAQNVWVATDTGMILKLVP
ncbi:MAG TPA: YCF48-related protein [Bryobacteraceae bacterium]|nr:YCF48-related protein [Bryobacteraceae bacterium]